MKISELVDQLQQVLERYGDIEVTCTGSDLEEGPPLTSSTFETTVENLVVTDGGIFGGTRVRLWL